MHCSQDWADVCSLSSLSGFQVDHVSDRGTVHLAQHKDSQAFVGLHRGYAAVLLSGQVFSGDNTAPVVQGCTEQGGT